MPFDDDLDHIASLATVKMRTPHYIMQEAILGYMKRGEARPFAIGTAEFSLEHDTETGIRISLDEFGPWVDDSKRGRVRMFLNATRKAYGSGPI